MAQRWVAASGETFARWQIAATRYNACSQNNRPGRFVERNLLRHRRRKTYWLGGIGCFDLARTGGGDRARFRLRRSWRGGSEERRVGNEGVSTFRSRWGRYRYQTKKELLR